MTVFIISISSVLLVILVCYMMFKDVNDKEHSILEPSEWTDIYNICWRITKLPYGYILEKSYNNGDTWQHHYDYNCKGYSYEIHNGLTVEYRDFFNSYDEARKYLFDNRKGLKYEHL